MFCAQVRYLKIIRAYDGGFITIRLIAGEREAQTDIHTHLASPVEAVANRRREICSDSRPEIDADPDVAVRREPTELQIGTSMQKQRSDETVGIIVIFHTKTRTDEEHRIYLITMRSRETCEEHIIG